MKNKRALILIIVPLAMAAVACVCTNSLLGGSEEGVEEVLDEIDVTLLPTREANSTDETPAQLEAQEYDEFPLPPDAEILEEVLDITGPNEIGGLRYTTDFAIQEVATLYQEALPAAGFIYDESSTVEAGSAALIFADESGRRIVFINIASPIPPGIDSSKDTIVQLIELESGEATQSSPTVESNPAWEFKQVSFYQSADGTQTTFTGLLENLGDVPLEGSVYATFLGADGKNIMPQNMVAEIPLHWAVWPGQLIPLEYTVFHVFYPFLEVVDVAIEPRLEWPRPSEMEDFREINLRDFSILDLTFRSAGVNAVEVSGQIRNDSPNSSASTTYAVMVFDPVGTLVRVKRDNRHTYPEMFSPGETFSFSMTIDDLVETEVGSVEMFVGGGCAIQGFEEQTGKVICEE